MSEKVCPSLFATVARKTKTVITVATPHLGSPDADAVYGTSDTLCGNFVGALAGWLGERSDATYWLRTFHRVRLRER
jgi:hypothetical protein